MAKEYRWFKISEANAEIDRLEKELTSAKASAAAAVENDSEIANQASRLQKEVDSFKDQISKNDAVVAAITAERDAAKAEALKAKTDADAHTKDFDAKVEAKASEKAAAINASLGVPPAGGSVAGDGKKDFMSLVAAKVIADKCSKGSAVAALVKSNPAEYADWLASGKTQTL